MSDSIAEVLFICFIVVGFSIISCIGGIEYDKGIQLENLKARCNKIGGKIMGDTDTPDILKPCVVNGKEIF